jgi:hypothetical protein
MSRHVGTTSPKHDTTIKQSASNGSSIRNMDTSEENGQKEDYAEEEVVDCKECPHARILSKLMPLLVFVDGFSVSLVVPLLHQYYKRAGVTSATQRELLASLFSAAQIAGGLVLGFLSDSQYLSRRSLLLLSFVGSAIAYYMITIHTEEETSSDVFGGENPNQGRGGGDIRFIMASRVLVGLIKQTMTVSSAFLARCTPQKDLATKMARLQASFTVAWIAGPSAGALLYKMGQQWEQRIELFGGRITLQSIYLPIYVSCALFSLNAALLFIMVPADTESKMEINSDKNNKGKDKDKTGATTNKDKKSNGSFFAKLQTCFTSKALATTVMALLLHGWVLRTTSYQKMASYYEEKYGIEPHQRGYLTSFQMALAFLVQSFGVGPLLSLFGQDERYAVCAAAFMVTVLTLIEIRSNFIVFLSGLVPMIAVCNVMLGVSLKSLLSQVTPKESIGSVFAAVDVLQNAAAVTVPFYRTLLFRVLNRFEISYLRQTDDNEKQTEECHSLMEGDPNPNLWLVSSAVHWALATAACCCLLLPNKRLLKPTAAKYKKE